VIEVLQDFHGYVEGSGGGGLSGNGSGWASSTGSGNTYSPRRRQGYGHGSTYGFGRDSGGACPVDLGGGFGRGHNPKIFVACPEPADFDCLVINTLCRMER
jgi:hypothetical protein